MGGHGCLNLRLCSTSAAGRASAAASSCSYSAVHHARAHRRTGAGRGAAKFSCSAASAQAPPSQSTIKVVIVGATKEIGRAAIVAVSRARGMELAGAIDTQCIGQDAGELSGMEEPLEIPVLNDLTMVLGSIAQSRGTGVVVDFSEPSLVYDNVKQGVVYKINQKKNTHARTQAQATPNTATMAPPRTPRTEAGSSANLVEMPQKPTDAGAGILTLNEHRR